MALQGGHSKLWDIDHSAAALRLRLDELKLLVDSLKGAADAQYLLIKIDLGPPERKGFTESQPDRQCDREKCAKPIGVGSLQQPSRLVRIKDPDFMTGRPRDIDQGRRVSGNEIPLQRL